jgi:hypothetical protein
MIQTRFASREHCVVYTINITEYRNVLELPASYVKI